MPHKIPAGQTISDIGLRKYLDDTASLHNGFNYEQFTNMVGDDPFKPKIDKANLSRVYNVSRGSIYRWLEEMKRELRDAR